MNYHFNIDDNRIDDEESRIKINKINNIYGFFQKGIKYELMVSVGLFTTMTMASFICRNIGFGDMNLVLKIVFCVLLVHLVFVLGQQVFRIEIVYRKIADIISSPVIINSITVFNDHKNEETENENEKIVPGIKISYSCNSLSKDGTAVMLKTDDEEYEIIDFIGRDKIDGNIEKIIPSDKVLEAINKCNERCVSEQNVMMFVVAQIEDNSEIYQIVHDKNMDDTIIITELIWMPYFKRREERDGS